MTSTPITTGTAAKVNVATVAAITVVSYLLTQFTHEGLGHGGMALLCGVKITQITNTYMDFDPTGVSAGVVRAITAAGTLANVVVGVLALGLLRSQAIKSANKRYFLWLLGHVNLLKGFGYLLVNFVPIGDWHDFVQGLPMQSLWTVGLVLLGAFASLGTFFYAARTLDEFIGKGPDRRRRAFVLTLVPYFLGGTINVLSTIIGLGITRYSFTGAWSTFGGTFLLVWLGLAIGRPKQHTPSEPSTPCYELSWVGAGGLAALFYLAWFGSGLIRP